MENDRTGNFVKNIKRLMVTRQSTVREALSLLNNSGVGMLLLHSAEGQFEQTITVWRFTSFVTFRC